MTAATFQHRRQAELRHARESLRAEWNYWQAEAMPDRTLEKHHTQIQSVVGLLGVGLGTLDQDQPTALTEQILDLHHVWDFFRAKLALRYVSPIRPFLDAADELAWSSYRPAIEAAGLLGTALREPPLVFLDRGAVPFASARDNSYRDLLPRDVRTRTGADAARHLPFPVIGVPWYLSSHLPGALLVAHEVGHHIEDDCGLDSELKDRLAGVDLKKPRRAQWENWLGEVFADVVASLSCGGAYLAVMLDALAAGPAGGAGEDRYPSPRVRGGVCRAAVAFPGLPAANEVTTDGATLGEPSVADEEAPYVVEAILSGPYEKLGGKTLPTVLRSPTVDAGTGANRLLAGLPSNLTDVRAVIAAAALAFIKNPETYDGRLVGQRAIDEVLALRPVGIRRLAVGDGESRRKRDAAAGHSILRLLSS